MKPSVHHLPTAPRGPRIGRFGVIGLATLLMLGLAPSGPGTASVLPGAKPKDWPANPDHHQVSIHRDGADETERRLIAAAEAAQPPRDAVQQAAGDTKLPESDKLWWYTEQLGIRIPYAITAEAVTYFEDLVRKYGSQTLNRYLQPSSRLEYHASIQFHREYQHLEKTFQNVRVVTLKLHFQQKFAATPTEAMDIVKERVVIFDSSGTLVLVVGDGPTRVPIMAI